VALLRGIGDFDGGVYFTVVEAKRPAAAPHEKEFQRLVFVVRGAKKVADFAAKLQVRRVHGWN
jgi:hypothetical protein